VSSDVNHHVICISQRVTEIVDFYAINLELLKDKLPKNQLSLEKDNYLIDS
jgi:hypothetical protein